MPTHTFSPVLGKRYRVTTLDDCGRVTGEAQNIIGDGFVTVTLSSETEEGVEIIQRKFTGALCVNEKQSDSFKRFTLEIEFCGVNPDLLSSVSNAQPYQDAAGDVAGFTVPEGDIRKAFALEIWMGLSGQACGEGEEEASGYLLLPFVQAGVLGDIEMGGEDAVTFSLTGSYTKGGNGWGTGPYNVVFGEGGTTPSVLPQALDPLDHLLLMDTGLSVPTITDALNPVEPVEGASVASFGAMSTTASTSTTADTTQESTDGSGSGETTSKSTESGGTTSSRSTGSKGGGSTKAA